MKSTHCYVDTEYELIFKFIIRHEGMVPIESEMMIDTSNLTSAFKDSLKDNLNQYFPGKVATVKQLPAKHINFFCATHVIYGVSETSIYLEFEGDEETPKFHVDTRSYVHERRNIFGSDASIEHITATTINGKYYYERKDGVLCPIKEIEEEKTAPN